MVVHNVHLMKKSLHSHFQRVQSIRLICPFLTVTINGRDGLNFLPLSLILGPASCP